MESFAVSNNDASTATRETHYLFKNCIVPHRRRHNTALPFWKVFLSNCEEIGGRKVVDDSNDESAFNLKSGFAETKDSNILLEGKQYNLKLVKEFRIEDGDMGFGYEKIFGDGIDDKLKLVIIDEPHIQNKSQITNLVAFCELLVSRASNLREIVLCTQSEQPYLHELWACLEQLRIDLMLRHVILKLRCNGTMHDREVRFDNGWTYRIGRGLDYFQKQQPLTLGITDFNLRKCQKTNVCILREMEPKKKFDCNSSF